MTVSNPGNLCTGDPRSEFAAKELTPAEYKFAAEQLAACLLNGIGVWNRMALQHSIKPKYEMVGWLQEACELTSRWYRTTGVNNE